MTELGAMPGAAEPTGSRMAPTDAERAGQPDERGAAATGETSPSPTGSSEGSDPAQAVAAAAVMTAAAEAPAAAVAEVPVARGRFRRPHFPRLRGRTIHLPRSRRGIFAMLLVLAGLGSVALFTGASLVRWTETADFCGRCHQMGPELAAYEAGPHRNVACAECHVEPGLAGWIKAKINGTKQLAQVILGLYPKPVPPPDHANLPSTSDTCQRCHSVQRLAIAQMKTATQFAEDEPNTRQFIGLMIRPNGGDVFDVNKSVHWHVLQDVEYRTSEPNAQKIDLVTVNGDNGAVETFIAQNEIKVSDDVQPDIDRLTSQDEQHRMDCLDCHNRVGHPIPNPRTSTDYALSTGEIDPSLPYIKRESMRLLWASYPSVDSANAAIDQLHEFYQLHYPDVAATKSPQIADAIAELKVLYKTSATPDMKVTAGTYPDNLGHMDFPGCFRCHDGGHYLVKDGKVTSEVIPATCNTCHTFPQIGAAVASLPLGTPPNTHSDPLWVFNHRTVAPSIDPGGTTCGECHARDYCVNCHKTGAVNVDHDQMLTNHAEVIRQTGNTACAYCHQPVYCARCHTEQVLPVTGPTWGAAPATSLLPPTMGAVRSNGPPTAPAGIAWPLLTIPGPGLVTSGLGSR